LRRPIIGAADRRPGRWPRPIRRVYTIC